MEDMGKDSELKKIPVIVISNSGQPVELDRARRLGAKDWLIKTEFDPQEVLDKVKKQIGK
jgi:PleD family two-component response regulator